MLPPRDFPVPFSYKSFGDDRVSPFFESEKSINADLANLMVRPRNAEILQGRGAKGHAVDIIWGMACGHKSKE